MSEYNDPYLNDCQTPEVDPVTGEPQKTMEAPNYEGVVKQEDEPLDEEVKKWKGKKSSMVVGLIMAIIGFILFCIYDDNGSEILFRISHGLIVIGGATFLLSAFYLITHTNPNK